MEDTGHTWEGTKLKYAVNMTCEGFDMDEDDWKITVVRGSKKMEFTKGNSVHSEDGQWYICIDTEYFGPGLMHIIFDASVPDDDFEDGIRTEKQKYVLTNIESL